jgi:hypothetical protein
MDNWSIYQKILEDAQVATGVRQVAMTKLDPATDRVAIVSLTGLGSKSFQRGLAVVRRVIPGFDPLGISFDAGVNELNSTIYHEGISVQAPLKDLADGIVNSVILAAAAKFHLSVYGLVCPLWVNGSVFGSIGFNSRKPLDQKQRLVCEAFASQAALTLENSRLAEQLSNQIETMERLTKKLPSSDASLTNIEAGANDPIMFEDIIFDPSSRTTILGGETLHLTPQEYSLLAFFLKNPRKALSREQLSQEVWGYKDESGSNFVDVTIMRLRGKLENGNRPRLIHSVRGYGYILRK